MSAKICAEEINMYLFDRGEAFGVKKDVDFFPQLPEVFQLEMRRTDRLALCCPQILPFYFQVFTAAFLALLKLRFHP